MLNDAIKLLTESWDAYRSGRTTNKDHFIHKLVVEEIPKMMKECTPNSTRYKFIGSDGQGNILRAPWFATLNLEVTNSATRGYYLVYLLSADLKTLVLEIGFGAQQFERQYGRGKKVFDALQRAVENMKINSEHLIEKSLMNTRKRTNVSPVVLDNSGDYNLRAYEKCAIYSLSYDVANLPSDEDLRSDYLEFLKLYDLMSESLLLAEVDSYVYETISDEVVRPEVQLIKFAPRTFKKRKESTSTSENYNSRRYSKTSDKVGKLGEKLVVEFEKAKLLKIERSDLAARVIWHRELPENRTPGWDVTSFDEQGREIFIEVKSSEGKKISDVELTVNEWYQAESHKETNQYKVYLLSDVFVKPVMEIIDNPARRVQGGELTLNIARYQLLLGVKES